jgi:hypothetical protein
MKNTYASLEEEDDLGIDYFSKGLHFDMNASSDLPVSSHSPNVHVNNESHCHGDAINSIVTLLLNMPCKHRTDLIQSLLTYYMQIEFGCDYTSFVSSDFVELCCKGFKELFVSGKDNIIYRLVKGLSTKRKDSSGPRLPIDGMPFGLLSYNIW